MLFKIDTLYGHIIEDTPQGPVYQDDGAPVDPENPRPCLGCKARLTPGSHDPCIANLPGTYQACCGHGLDRAPNSGRPNGYVGLTDGRTIEFSGLCGGARIREAVDAALAGKPLPEGFCYGERMWWEGLSDARRQFVQERIPQALAHLVREVTYGRASAAAFLEGEKPWWEGLTEEQKGAVWSRLPAALALLVQEALAQA